MKSYPQARVTELTKWQRPEHTFVTPVIWRRADIEAEVERLHGSALSPDQRTMRMTHAEAGDGMGASPGLSVTLAVLRPGESTSRHRHTNSVINYIRSGSGQSVIGGRTIAWEAGDIFTTPAWAPHHHSAASDSAPVVRLAFSDGPMLQKLGILLHDDDPEATPALAGEESVDMPAPPPGIALAGTRGQMLTYEQLIAPRARWMEPMLWPWKEVRAQLEHFDNDDPTYNGRRVMVYYHPGTGLAQGTTPTMFASAGVIAAGEVHVPHRHTSVAINYYIAGRGYSIIDGERMDWEAGDLHLTPAWAVHGHANDGTETVWGVNVQDSPLLYNVGALLWQEALGGVVAALGRADAEASTQKVAVPS